MKHCAACNRENPAEAVYCNRCGRPLTDARRDSDAPDPRAYTPRHLAARILRARSVIEGERKLVTVLFADVERSTQLVANLDPEDWHRIMNRFFQIAADAVHRFEGTVNQYTGDGIMALFGAPIAWEDHARRAGYAALELQAALRDFDTELRVRAGPSFGTRIGLNSGEVVVGRIGNDLRMDYTAQGYNTHLADRMQKMAEPGSICVAESTYRLAGDHFRFRDRGDITVEGSPHTVRVYTLEGPAEPRWESPRQTDFSCFIGRRAELAALDDALSRSLAGRGTVVGIVGEAGVGKSRLCVEFTRRCRSRGLPLFDAQGLSHGRAVPFAPVRQLLRGLCGVADPTAARAAIHRSLKEIGAEGSCSLMWDFLQVTEPDDPPVSTDPGGRQERLREIASALLAFRSREIGAAVAVEDLHWFDEASLRFLHHLIDGIAEQPVLMLVTARPERPIDHSRVTRLDIEALDQDATRQLVLDRLRDEEAASRVVDLIWSRTRGNPLFIRELLTAWIDWGALAGSPGSYRVSEGLEELPVPASLRALLGARIDRLEEDNKELLQTASVISDRFPRSLLDAAGAPRRSTLPRSRQRSAVSRRGP